MESLVVVHKTANDYPLLGDVTMAATKITKTVNAESNHLLLGNNNSETLTAANNNIFQIRGAGGNDTLTGNSRSDIFIFESSLSSNGKDTITNFKVYNPSTDVQDTLDLSQVFGSNFNKLINGSNVDNFVWIENGDLNIDKTGNHGSTSDNEIFANLKGINDGDQLHVRTTGFNGMIAAKQDLISETVNLHADFYDDADAGYIAMADPILETAYIASTDINKNGKVDDFRLYGLGAPIGDKIAVDTKIQIELLHNGEATGQVFEGVYNGWDAAGLYVDDTTFIGTPNADPGYALRFVNDHVAYVWTFNANLA